MLTDSGHYYNPLFPRQEQCVQCPSTIPPCNCAPNQTCERTTTTCSACAVNICRGDPNASKGSGGANGGAIAGGVIAAVLVIGLILAALFLYRRKVNAIRALQEKQQFGVGPLPRAHDGTSLRSPRSPVHPTSPAPGIEKPPGLYLNNSTSAVNLGQADPNPFSDSASVSTANSNNVIQIAYVPPNSDGRALSPTATQHSHIPARPARTPDLSLRPPPNSLAIPRSPAYPQSTKSGVSVFSNRTSIMSSASSFMYDSPTIVTSAQGRQVLGVVRAEVVQVPPTPGTPGTPPVPPIPQQPARLLPVARGRASAAAVGRSPLGAPSIRREDIELEVEPMPSPTSPGSPNPFSDRKAASRSSVNMSLKSSGTFGNPLNRVSPLLSPRHHPLPESRPESSVDPDDQASAPPTPRADGFAQPEATPTRDSYAAESMVSPHQHSEADDRDSVLMMDAANGGPGKPWRTSEASFMTTGSRADSILASFPFLPPSPAAPAFSQPSTPTNVRSFRGHGYTASQSTVGDFSEYQVPMYSSDTPPVPKVPANVPGRRANAFSTMSEVSTASSGLDAFPFHFGAGIPGNASDTGSIIIGQHPLAQSSTASLPSPPSAFGRGGSDRASLDTMALSKDLETYPLGYDRHHHHQNV